MGFNMAFGDKAFTIFGLTICAITFVTMTAGSAVLLAMLMEQERTKKGRER